MGSFSRFRVSGVPLFIPCIPLHNIASHRILIALLLLCSHYTGFRLPFSRTWHTWESNPWFAHYLKWHPQQRETSYSLPAQHDARSSAQSRIVSLVLRARHRMHIHCILHSTIFIHTPRVRLAFICTTQRHLCIAFFHHTTCMHHPFLPLVEYSTMGVSASITLV